MVDGPSFLVIFNVVDIFVLLLGAASIMVARGAMWNAFIFCGGVPSAESSRSVQGLGKGVSGKPYPRLCNARRPRLEPGTFRS